MFEFQHRPTCTWSFTARQNSNRREVTAVGFYVIEHISTGKLLVGFSKTVSQDVDQQISALMAGKHPNRLAQRQVENDYDLKLHEFPTISITAAKDAVRQLKKSVTPLYLLLNP